MSTSNFKIAIIGRPNVGKSTLFNKLVGRKFAITSDIAGVTRDRKESHGSLGPMSFIITDTAGLENEILDSSLEKRMVEQSEIAAAAADLCLFVVDGRVGITNKDKFFADWLRKKNHNIVLVINKMEGQSEIILDKEYYRLGFKNIVAVSAEHNEGFSDLYDKISPFFNEYQKHFANLESDEKLGEKAIQIAIAGRPNAGKSTFLNQILQEERLVTGPEAGITRDAISIDYEILNRQVKLIDTAGIRRKTNVNGQLEELSLDDSFRAIRFAHVVILLIDATSLLDHQDMALAGQIISEGRAIIFAINKIDLVTIDREVFMRQVRKQLQELFPEVAGSIILGVCALNGFNMQKILEGAITTYDQWQSRLPTARLNEWLIDAANHFQPPLFKGKVTKLKYVSQIKDRPPTFAIFVNNIKAISDSYHRYLVNSLRKYFDLKLTPVRIVFKKSENPFIGKDKKPFKTNKISPLRSKRKKTYPK